MRPRLIAISIASLFSSSVLPVVADTLSSEETQQIMQRVEEEQRSLVGQLVALNRSKFVSAADNSSYKDTVSLQLNIPCSPSESYCQYLKPYDIEFSHKITKETDGSIKVSSTPLLTAPQRLVVGMFWKAGSPLEIQHLLRKDGSIASSIVVNAFSFKEKKDSATATPLKVSFDTSADKTNRQFTAGLDLVKLMSKEVNGQLKGLKTSGLLDLTNKALGYGKATGSLDLFEIKSSNRYQPVQFAMRNVLVNSVSGASKESGFTDSSADMRIQDIAVNKVKLSNIHFGIELRHIDNTLVELLNRFNHHQERQQKLSDVEDGYRPFREFDEILDRLPSYVNTHPELAITDLSANLGQGVFKLSGKVSLGDADMSLKPAEAAQKAVIARADIAVPQKALVGFYTQVLNSVKGTSAAQRKADIKNMNAQIDSLIKMGWIINEQGLLKSTIRYADQALYINGVKQGN